MSDTVSFTYDHPVTCPPAQAGGKGETKQLKRADAEHLVALGYGTIGKDANDHGEPTPKLPSTTSTTGTRGSSRRVGDSDRDPKPAEQSPA